MQDDQPDEQQQQLQEVRAERDTLRRELNDLRSWLCVKLGILDRLPGPQGITVLSTVSDREIIAEVERLKSNASNPVRQEQIPPHPDSVSRSPQTFTVPGAPPPRNSAPQAFTVEVTDHQGRPIASIQLTRELVIRLPRIGDARYPVLRFVDPYGDTTLNTLQVAQLLIELDQLHAEVSEPAALECIEALAAVARTAQTQPHNELTFVGD